MKFWAGDGTERDILGPRPSEPTLLGPHFFCVLPPSPARLSSGPTTPLRRENWEGEGIKFMEGGRKGGGGGS